MATSADLPQEHATRSNEITTMLEVKVALVGQTGSGKSSYINAIREYVKQFQENSHFPGI